MNRKLALILFLIFGLVSCKNKTDIELSNKTSGDSTIGGLEKQKQSLEQKEKQLQEETERLKQLKSKNDSILKNSGGINLNDFWSGSLKGEIPFDLEISDFNGKDFKGHEQIFIPDKPEGKKIKITGTFDPKTRNIVIEEDNTIKGTGKLKGIVDKEGNEMSGKWQKYAGNEEYKWQLKRSKH
jgi:hypothetical protein